MTTTNSFGPWFVTTSLAPGQTEDSVWNIDPDPNYYSYQITAFPTPPAGFSGPNYKGHLQVVETSLEIVLENNGGLVLSRSTIHAKVKNVGADTVRRYAIMISTVSE